MNRVDNSETGRARKQEKFGIGRLNREEAEKHSVELNWSRRRWRATLSTDTKPANNKSIDKYS